MGDWFLWHLLQGRCFLWGAWVARLLVEGPLRWGRARQPLGEERCLWGVHLGTDNDQEGNAAMEPSKSTARGIWRLVMEQDGALPASGSGHTLATHAVQPHLKPRSPQRCGSCCQRDCWLTVRLMTITPWNPCPQTWASDPRQENDGLIKSRDTEQVRLGDLGKAAPSLSICFPWRVGRTRYGEDNLELRRGD